MIRSGFDPRSLVCSRAGDETAYLGRTAGAVPVCRGHATVYAVMHRGAELFTHLYLVPERPGREVHLAAIFPGAAIEAAHALACDRYGLEGPGDEALAA